MSSSSTTVTGLTNPSTQQLKIDLSSNNPTGTNFGAARDAISIKTGVNENFAAILVDNKNSSKPSGLKIWDANSTGAHGALGTIYAGKYDQVVFWKKVYSGHSGAEECESKGAVCMFVVKGFDTSPNRGSTGHSSEVTDCKIGMSGNNDYAFCARTNRADIFR